MPSNVSTERHCRTPRYQAILRKRLRAANARRSVRNILDWNGYLPIDCVKAMVRMGWDYST